MITTARRFSCGLMVSAALLGTAILVFAQTLNVKPGLWEVTSVTQTSGMPPIDTSKMTPEQRAQIEAAMKASQAKEGTPKTTRECMTKEKIEQQLFQDQAMPPSCKRTAIANTPSLQEFTIQCSEQGTMSGRIRIEAITPENVRGSIQTGMEGRGQRMNVNATFTAKWLSASCGDVK